MRKLVIFVSVTSVALLFGAWGIVIRKDNRIADDALLYAVLSEVVRGNEDVTICLNVVRKEPVDVVMDRLAVSGSRIRETRQCHWNGYKWLGPNGEHAAQVRVNSARCNLVGSCDVQFDTIVGNLGGEGHLARVTRREGKWHIDSVKRLWIS